MKKIVLTLAMLVLAISTNALTLEECVLRGNSPRGIGNVYCAAILPVASVPCSPPRTTAVTFTA